MANNYVQFSQTLTIDTPEQEKWLKEMLETPDEKKLEKLEIDDWPGFSYELDAKSLWVYSEEGGDINNLVYLVQEFLKKFKPKACWCLTWAETCSKMRVDEFSGSGVLVTAKKVYEFCPSSQIHSKITKLGLKRI